MRICLALGMLLLTGVVSSAAEAIRYPLAIPQGCVALADHEGYPTMIANRLEGLKARAKLAWINNSDPLVHQCKDAVAPAVAAHKALRD